MTHYNVDNTWGYSERTSWPGHDLWLRRIKLEHSMKLVTLAHVTLNRIGQRPRQRWCGTTRCFAFSEVPDGSTRR